MIIDDNDKESFLERLLQRKWTYIVLTIIFFSITFLCFIWGHPIRLFNKEYVINHELFGTFGDFFGGVLGTIFTLISVLLVVRTFRHQQIVTRDNHKQQETQRFNNLFFELLRLYQEQEKELQYEEKEGNNSYLCNYKDFFSELYKNFLMNSSRLLHFHKTGKKLLKLI